MGKKLVCKTVYGFHAKKNKAKLATLSATAVSPGVIS